MKRVLLLLAFAGAASAQPADTLRVSLTDYEAKGYHAYVVDGVEAPVLRLDRGTGYVFAFDLRGGGPSHPFYISTADDAHGAEPFLPLDTFPAWGQSAVTFTLPESAPDTLYYACAAHYGMGNMILTH